MGFMRPTGGLPCFDRPSFIRAISPAHNGATALVPPMMSGLPPTSLTLYPACGSASPATSGTPRPTLPVGDFGTPDVDGYAGRGQWLLTSPPVAPLPSFHTVSSAM